MIFQQFIQEFRKLKQKYPHPPSFIFDCENSDYDNYLAHCKNAYFCFDTSYSHDLIYQFDAYQVNNCIDGDYVVKSENCYECVDVFKAYNSTYLNYCARIYDSHFCYDCDDSNNLFGCAYVKFKQYCIFNKQYSKEDYEKKIKELLQKPAEENLREMNKLFPLFPVTSTNISHAENSDYGNHVHYCKNMYLCFDCARSENCAYLYDSHQNKSCYDMTQTFLSEFCYECIDCSRLNNCFYMKDCIRVFDSGFSENCTNSNHLFGCFGLNNKQYCILNKKYSEEKYKTNVSEIVASFRQTTVS